MPPFRSRVTFEASNEFPLDTGRNVRYNVLMTPKQYELYIFIRNRLVHFGKAPTFSEMKKQMKVTSNQTIGDWLQILEREGYIAKNKGKLRGLSITDKGMRGFDENLQLQSSKAIKKSFVPIYSNATTSANVFNASPPHFYKRNHYQTK